MNGMEKLALDDATDEQVRAFARTFLSLEGADAKAIKQVRQDVKDAWPQNFIWILKAPEPQAAAPVFQPAPGISKEQIELKAGAGIAPTSSKNDPVVMLTISKTDQPGGKDPVFLNVNGNAIHIARGMPQAVPFRFFFDVMQTIQRLWNWNEKTSEMTSEDVTRFGVNILKFPSEDEIFSFLQHDAALSNQSYSRERFEQVDRRRYMALVGVEAA